MEYLKLLLREVAVPTVVLGAVAWLSREIVQRLLALQAERTRVNLENASTLAIERVRQEASKEIESIRHTLSLDLERQRSRFGRLQEVRLEPLVHLHSQMTELLSAAERIQTELRHFPDDDISELLEKLLACLRDAESALARAVLFLPSDLAQSIESLLVKIRDAEMYYDIAVRYRSLDAVSARAELGERLTQNFSEAARSLTARFRPLLGVESTDELVRLGGG